MCKCGDKNCNCDMYKKDEKGQNKGPQKSYGQREEGRGYGDREENRGGRERKEGERREEGRKEYPNKDKNNGGRR